MRDCTLAARAIDIAYPRVLSDQIITTVDALNARLSGGVSRAAGSGSPADNLSKL